MMLESAYIYINLINGKKNIYGSKKVFLNGKNIKQNRTTIKGRMVVS